MIMIILTMGWKVMISLIHIPFHNRSSVRRYNNMKHYFGEDNDSDLIVKLEIPDCNGSKKGEEFYEWLNTKERYWHTRN